MLQDIAPYTYCNAMRFAPPDPDDLVLACAPGGVFARVESGMLILPTVGQCTGISRWTYAFSIDRTRYFLPGNCRRFPAFPSSPITGRWGPSRPSMHAPWERA